MKTTWRSAIVTLIALASVVVASPTPSQAAADTSPGSGSTMHAARASYLPVSGVTVCRSQGHFGGSFWWYWNPASWYCYDLSIPWGISIAGSPNFGAYCRARGYPIAEAYPWNTMSWRCYRR
ncbi:MULTISPECIES: hypothetical protein [unclassified Nocardioides]|uniref:hypothetical protein n=1 Tax=unclassified Nocardioides TaxID=2615069 RepID=UPI0010555DBC|nr:MULTISPECIES: hypothetical protein [unclassified Nocardioides]